LAAEEVWEGREKGIAACDVSKSNVFKLPWSSLSNIRSIQLLIFWSSWLGLLLALQRGRPAVVVLLGWCRGCPSLHPEVALGQPSVSPAFLCSSVAPSLSLLLLPRQDNCMGLARRVDKPCPCKQCGCCWMVRPLLGWKKSH